MCTSLLSSLPSSSICGPPCASSSGKARTLAQAYSGRTGIWKTMYSHFSRGCVLFALLLTALFLMPPFGHVNYFWEFYVFIYE